MSSLLDLESLEVSTPLPLRSKVYAFSTNISYFGKSLTSSRYSLTPVLMACARHGKDATANNALTRFTQSSLFDVNVLRLILPFTLPDTIPKQLRVAETRLHPKTTQTVLPAYAVRTDGDVVELDDMLGSAHNFLFRYSTMYESNVVMAPSLDNEIVTLVEDGSRSLFKLLLPPRYRMFTLASNARYTAVAVAPTGTGETYPFRIAIAPLATDFTITHSFRIPIDFHFDLYLHPHLDLLLMVQMSNVYVVNFKGQITLHIAREPHDTMMVNAVFSPRHDAIVVSDSSTTKLIIPLNDCNPPYVAQVMRTPLEDVWHHINHHDCLIESWTDDAGVIGTHRYTWNCSHPKTTGC